MTMLTLTRLISLLFCQYDCQKSRNKNWIDR